jgi:hypothetical protein
MLLSKLFLTAIMCIGLESSAVFAGETKLLAQASSATQGTMPETLLKKLFTTNPKEFKAEWFAPDFKAQPPYQSLSSAEAPKGVVEYVTKIKNGQGAFQRVQKSGEKYLVVLKIGAVPTEIKLDPEGRISKLVFSQYPTPVPKS